MSFRNRYALILLGLIIIGGHIYANMETAVSDIVFDHELHTDLDCADCHSSATTSKASADKLYPEMDFCGECHDLDDDENCGQCHLNPEEPEASPNPVRDLNFNHEKHYQLEIDCSLCHSNMSEQASGHLPTKPACMSCHDGNKATNDCQLCHGDKYTLLDIHPLNWRHQHGEQANDRSDFCQSCHQKSESFCIDCHRGDNPTGNIHDLNYKLTHGLDASANSSDCSSCHDNRDFCNACHESELRIPLEHSTLNWLSAHGQKARNDVENCASCHDSADPTCARSGCHRDSDGIRGTDNRIHSDDLAFFEIEGPWHSDNGYYCYQCHTNTNISGLGFCGYCHGSEE